VKVAGKWQLLAILTTEVAKSCIRVHRKTATAMPFLNC
jgi:hypothetical protein